MTKTAMASASPAWCFLFMVVAYVVAMSWRYHGDEMRLLAAEFNRHVKSILCTLPKLAWAALALAVVMLLHPVKAVRALKGE